MRCFPVIRLLYALEQAIAWVFQQRPRAYDYVGPDMDKYIANSLLMY